VQAGEGVRARKIRLCDKLSDGKGGFYRLGSQKKKEEGEGEKVKGQERGCDGKAPRIRLQGETSRKTTKGEKKGKAQKRGRDVRLESGKSQLPKQWLLRARWIPRPPENKRGRSQLRKKEAEGSNEHERGKRRKRREVYLQKTKEKEE